MTDERDTDNVPTQPIARPDAASEDSVPDEEEIATPLPHSHVPVVIDSAPGEPPAARRSGLVGVLVGVALVLSLAALILTVAVIYSLSNAQREAVRGIDSAINVLDNLQGEGFHYEYRFEKTIPVSSSIPIQEEMVIPFSGDFPINTVVEVPINAGILGTFNIDVPINTSVQVDTDVPIRVDQTFEISTSIPVSMVIPIDVRPDDPAIQDRVSNLRAWLVDLRDSLDTGLRFPLLGD